MRCDACGQPLPVDVADSIERLTGHSCIMCPVEVRDLMACAHNLCAWLLNQPSIDLETARRARALQDSIGRMTTLAAEHFAAVDKERDHG